MTDFMQLPASERDAVDAWRVAFEAVQPPVTTALRAIAARLGASYGTALRKWYRFKRGGALALAHRAKASPAVKLAPDFLEYWRGLCQLNGRKCKPAYREFVRRFRRGDPLPGLPPATSRLQLPRGYTYANLMRHAPTKFELAAARLGRSAASNFRPLVLTTRLGLSVGQFVEFDDVWHDFKVVVNGQRRPARLLQLHAHDVFSACQFARGLKPRLEDPETGTAVQLTEDEMFFLVAHVLEHFGYRPNGTVFICEHGTAAISEEHERLLFELSAGQITVRRSGIQGVSVFAGQYGGMSRGNFRMKASLESSHNLLHNETAGQLEFPGQTGANSRTSAPEDLYGREQHARVLLRAMAALPPAVVEQLRLPFLEVTAASWLVNEICERINRRTEHELEGWVEAGLTAVDYAVPGLGTLPAAAVLALPPEKRAVVEQLAQPAPRRLSPREVFDAGQRDLVRFRPEQIARLLYGRPGYDVRVDDDHLIEFQAKEVSPSPLRYVAHTRAPGDKFHAVCNPFAPDKLHLFDAQGRWQGQVRTWQKIRPDDVEALHRQMGAAAKIEKQLLAPVAARGAALTRKRLADAQHNATVLLADDDEAETNAALEEALH